MLWSASIPSETLQPSLALVRRHSSIFAYVCGERGVSEGRAEREWEEKGWVLGNSDAETTQSSTQRESVHAKRLAHQDISIIFTMIHTCDVDSWQSNALTHTRTRTHTPHTHTECRGFCFAAPVAIALKVPYIPMRKPGKLPSKSIGVDFKQSAGKGAAYFGKDRLEMHEVLL